MLAQKPLAKDLAAARPSSRRPSARLDAGREPERTLGAAPRIATLLVQQGAIGEVHSVTHLLDRTSRSWSSSHFDAIEHLLVYDHCVHWVDISRCWLDGKAPESVRALEYRSPGQPPEAKQPWGAWIDIHYADGSSATVRSVGGSRTARPGCPFWIHGTEGTIRGSLLLGSDFVELERDGATERFDLVGAWWRRRLRGRDGQSLSAVAEGREPYNSGRHNLLSLGLTPAAARLGRGRRPAGQADMTKRIAAGICSGARCSSVNRRSGRRSRRNAK